MPLQMSSLILNTATRIMESNKIIAINNDPEAPIFDIAHYGIVGNAEVVIPIFIETFKHKLK